MMDCFGYKMSKNCKKNKSQLLELHVASLNRLFLSYQQSVTITLRKLKVQILFPGTAFFGIFALKNND